MGKNYNPNRSLKGGILKNNNLHPAIRLAEGICNFPEDRQLFAIRNITNAEVLQEVEKMTSFDKVKEAVKNHPVFKQEDPPDE